MLGVELTPAERHQLKSEGGLFHQSEEAELLEVDREMRETLISSVHTGSRGCLDFSGKSVCS